MTSTKFRIVSISDSTRKGIEREIADMRDGQVTEILGVRVWRTPSRLSGGSTHFNVGPAECHTFCQSAASAVVEVERLVTTDAIAQCPDRPQVGGCMSDGPQGGTGFCVYCGRSLEGA